MEEEPSKSTPSAADNERAADAPWKGRLRSRMEEQGESGKAQPTRSGNEPARNHKPRTAAQVAKTKRNVVLESKHSAARTRAAKRLGGVVGDGSTTAEIGYHLHKEIEKVEKEAEMFSERKLRGLLLKADLDAYANVDRGGLEKIVLSNKTKIAKKRLADMLAPPSAVDFEDVEYRPPI